MQNLADRDMGVRIRQKWLGITCLVIQFNVPEIVPEMDIQLYQMADLEVVEGDSTTLHCCWRVVNQSKFRVSWNKTEVQTLHQPTAVRYDGEGCGSALSPVNHSQVGYANLTLTNVTHNHAGRYICKVTRERPILIQLEGNGTTITVMERLRPTNGTTLQSMCSLPQSLTLFIFQTKSIFT